MTRIDPTDWKQWPCSCGHRIENHRAPRPASKQPWGPCKRCACREAWAVAA